jgi:hypothetical protein
VIAMAGHPHIKYLCQRARYHLKELVCFVFPFLESMRSSPSLDLNRTCVPLPCAAAQHNEVL